MKSTRASVWALALVLAVGLVVAPAAPVAAQEAKIVFAVPPWGNTTVETATAALMLEKMGYTVEQKTMDIGLAYQALASGDADAMMSGGPYWHRQYWDRWPDKLLTLAANTDNIQHGWMVPCYVPEDINMTNLNDHADLFGGKIVGIDPGSGVMQMSERAMTEYNLTNFKLLDGSDVAMAASLAKAYAKKEPIIIVAWRPHWLVAKYCLRTLEDPKLLITLVIADYTAVNRGFLTKYGAATRFFHRFYLDVDDVSAMQLEMEETKEEADVVAQRFIDAHPEMVAFWTRELKNPAGKMLMLPPIGP